MLFVWMTFVGAIIAVAEGTHLGMDSLVKRLPRAGVIVCAIIGDVLIVACCLLLGQGAWTQTVVNMGNHAIVSGIPLGVVHASVLAASIGMALIVGGRLWRVLHRPGRAAGSYPSQRHRRKSVLRFNGGQMTITIFIGSLLGAMAIGMPIAFALLVCGIALMFHLDNFDTQILAQNLIGGADSFPLLAVPFFMLTGEVMTSGGLSRRIVNLAVALCGHFRGGLGYVAIAASVLMASMSGSAVADTAALGAILIPMMRAANYNLGRASGLIASGGIIAPMMPLSIPFIVFGVTSGVSIGKLFLAGIAPGLMMALALLAAWWLVARKDDVEPLPKQPFSAVIRAFVDGFWALMIPVIVLGGIKAGVFTPTEAAVVAAVYSLFVSLVVYRELKVSMLYRVFLAAGKTTAVVMFLVATATVSSWLIAIADLPRMVADMLAPFIDDKILLMFLIMVLVVIVGTALDLMPTILIMTPVLMPIVQAGGHRPGLFRGPVHPQQRDRPDHAAGRHRAQCHLGCGQDLARRHHQGSAALPGRPPDPAVSAHPLPGAGPDAPALAALAGPPPFTPPWRTP